jgi:hypothetical protein
MVDWTEPRYIVIMYENVTMKPLYKSYMLIKMYKETCYMCKNKDLFAWNEMENLSDLC